MAQVGLQTASLFFSCNQKHAVIVFKLVKEFLLPKLSQGKTSIAILKSAFRTNGLLGLIKIITEPPSSLLSLDRAFQVGLEF